MRIVGRSLLLIVVILFSLSRHAAAREAITPDELQQRFPGLALREVSLSEFNELTRDPLQVAQVVVGPAADASQVDTNLAVAATTAVPSSGRAAHRRPRNTYNGESWNFSFAEVGNIDSKESAIIVFVTAGVIVIAAAVVYTGALIYNLVADFDEAPPFWWEPSVHGLYFSSGSQQGWMTGGGVTMGFEGEGGDVGLTLEGGYLNANVVTVDDKDVNISGGYGLAGPVVRWYFGSGPQDYRLDMEFLAGGASGYSLISRAGAALNWAATQTLRFGIRFGALYLDVEETEGPVLKAGSDFNIYLGLETATQF